MTSGYFAFAGKILTKRNLFRGALLAIQGGAASKTARREAGQMPALHWP